jgi:hypothetical protein
MKMTILMSRLMIMRENTKTEIGKGPGIAITMEAGITIMAIIIIVTIIMEDVITTCSTTL